MIQKFCPKGLSVNSLQRQLMLVKTKLRKMITYRNLIKDLMRTIPNIPNGDQYITSKSFALQHKIVTAIVREKTKVSHASTVLLKIFAVKFS